MHCYSNLTTHTIHYQKNNQCIRKVREWLLYYEQNMIVILNFKHVATHETQ